MRGFLEKRALKKVQSKKVQLPYQGLENAEKVLILFQNESTGLSAMTQSFKTRFEELGKQVKTLGYIPKKRKKDEPMVDGFYHKNELNLLQLPKKDYVQELTESSFDVVIDLDHLEKTPNVFILLAVKSGISVGLSSHKPYYDLVMNNDEGDTKALIDNTIHFLNNIEKK